MKALLTITLIPLINFVGLSQAQAGLLDTDNGISATCSVYWSADCYEQVKKTPEWRNCMEAGYQRSQRSQVPQTNLQREIASNTVQSPEAIAFAKASYWANPNNQAMCTVTAKQQLGY